MLLTLDPGLDDTSYTLWNWPARVVPLPDLPRYLVEVGTWPTRPGAPLEVRLTDIGRSLRAFLGHHAIVRVVIEQPKYAGTYQRMRPGQKTTVPRHAAGLAREREAAGVLAGVCIAADIPWEWDAPSSVRVADRVERLRVLNLLPARSNPDQRAALLLGVAVLTDARRRLTKADISGAIAPVTTT